MNFRTKLLLLTYFVKWDQNAEVFADIFVRKATLNYPELSGDEITYFSRLFHSEIDFSFQSKNFDVFSI